MKLYRVELENEYGESVGFRWVRSRRAASKLVHDYCTKGGMAQVEVVECTPTKAGIVLLLNRIATHADLGVQREALNKTGDEYPL